jgi:hypothetical protein
MDQIELRGNGQPIGHMALPDDHHRRRAAGLGTTDEQCAQKGVGQSVARQPGIVFADRGVLECRVDVPAAAGKVGAGAFAGLTITANILMSLVIDKFGLFGMETHALSVGRMAGAALMAAGIAFISLF